MIDERDPIYIVGAGAIGKALAILLQSAGRNVTLVRGSTDQQNPSSEQLELLLPDGSKTTGLIPVTTFASLESLNGIVVIASKSFGNERLAGLLKSRSASAPIVLLQNGLNVETAFIEANFPHIYRCVLFVTSQLLNNKLVQFKPVASCPIGIVSGNSIVLKQLAGILTVPGFTFHAYEFIQRVAWKKTILNAVFNTVCSLLETDNGLFRRNEHALNIARSLMQEGIAVAASQGIDFDLKELEAGLLAISKASDKQLISTLQDIRMGRQTELDTLNAAIAEVAENNGLPGAATRIKLLGELTQLKAAMAIKKEEV